MSVASFNADLKKFSKQTGLQLDVIVRKLALDAYDAVTKKTPVDTGRAKGNWNLGAGKMDTVVTEETRTKHPTLKKGDGKKVLYITNHLPYIQALENGHSTQAPIGMVDVTVSEMEASIK